MLFKLLGSIHSPGGMLPVVLAFMSSLVFAGEAASQECVRFDTSVLVEPGHLLMATSPTLPPMSSVDASGKMKGLRIELGSEIAKRLCLEAKHISIDYPAMIPGLQADRFDFLNGGMFVTTDRTKIMYMLAYENMGVAISTKKDVTDQIKSPDDLSGKVVATDLGSYTERKMRELSKDFESRGLKPIDLRIFDNFAASYQSLRAGQVDAVAAIDPVAKEYEARGEFGNPLKNLYATPGALCFKNKTLAEAVMTAFKAMKADGTLDRLMDKYGVPLPDGGASLMGPA